MRRQTGPPLRGWGDDAQADAVRDDQAGGLTVNQDGRSMWHGARPRQPVRCDRRCLRSGDVNCSGGPMDGTVLATIEFEALAAT